MPKTTVSTGGSVAAQPVAPPPPKAEYDRAKRANTEATRVGRSPHITDTQVVREYEGHRAAGQAAYDAAVSRIAWRKTAKQPLDQDDVARVAQFETWARESGL